MKVILLTCCLLLAAIPHLSHGCSVAANSVPERPTDEALLNKSSAVFTAKVTRIAKVTSPANVDFDTSNLYKLNVRVKKWLKGTGGKNLTVFGSDMSQPCPSWQGVADIISAKDDLNHAESESWLIFASEYKGHLWVVTASPVNSEVVERLSK